ncbi:MAG: hypothetical protein RR536_06255 [Anaerovoracaceae bacterium]
MKNIKIAMLGYGVAGKAFARILQSKHDEIQANTNCDLKVVAIATGSHGSLVNQTGIDLAEATKQLEELGSFDKSKDEYTNLNALEIANTVDYDILLELSPLNIETGLPATDHIRSALNRGKHVVSANKGPLAWHYGELKNLAIKNNVKFYFETTVMAGTPVFNMADNCLQYCQISKVEGIFNATTNYILKEMAKGIPYDEIIQKGREEGFMEADVSMDTKGWDATAKLTVLLNVLMDANITPMDVDRTGIEDVTIEDINNAAENGNVIKLICSGTRDSSGKVIAKVAPCQVSNNDVFADKDLVAVLSVYTDLMGKLTTLQYGLETTQTGYGVFADVIRIVDQIKAI